MPVVIDRFEVVPTSEPAPVSAVAPAAGPSTKVDGPELAASVARLMGEVAQREERVRAS